mgnify:CR=1 FL=1
MKHKKKQYDELEEDNLGLPGPKLTEEQLDKILAKGDGESYEINEAFDMIRANLAKKRKKNLPSTRFDT